MLKESMEGLSAKVHALFSIASAYPRCHAAASRISEVHPHKAHPARVRETKTYGMCVTHAQGAGTRAMRTAPRSFRRFSG